MQTIDINVNVILLKNVLTLNNSRPVTNKTVTHFINFSVK